MLDPEPIDQSAPQSPQEETGVAQCVTMSDESDCVVGRPTVKC